MNCQYLIVMRRTYTNFIYEDAKDAIFVGTREGLYKLNNEKDHFDNLVIQDEVLRKNLGPYFLSIAKDSDGKYWLGTLGGGYSSANDWKISLMVNLHCITLTFQITLHLLITWFLLCISTILGGFYGLVRKTD